MNKIKFFQPLLVFILILSLGNYGFTVTQDYQTLFRSSIASKKLKYDKFGLVLMKKVGPGKWLKVLGKNEKAPMIPASLSKIITSVGLFETYGINHTISTELLSDSKPNQGVINGNLYVKGGGDPTLVTEKLWLLVNELSLWGVKKINGNVILDDTVFDQKLLDAGRKKWNQRAYNASITGLPVNWNSVRVRLMDSASLLAVTDPINPYFDVRVRKNFRKGSQVDIKSSKNKELLKVSYGKDALEKEKSYYRRVFSPRNSFQSQLVSHLNKLGVSVSGKVLWSKAPQKAFLLGKVESPAMSRLVKMMMKHSNNFIADSMVKYTDHKRRGVSGVYQSGLKQLMLGLAKAYSFKNPWHFESASGLSRKNQLSPEDLSELLRRVNSRPYFPEFLVSLPISCMDGTLRDRLCKRPGQVRAKTGLLAGVSTLAGYMRSSSDEEYLFAFMYNGRNGDQFSARETFDRFLERL